VSESRLQKTEAALELMGKLQAFLESASEDMPDGPRSKKRRWPRTGRCLN
jgi:transposase